MRDYYSYLHISPAARKIQLNSIVERIKEYDECLEKLSFSKSGFQNLNHILNQEFDWKLSLNSDYFKGPVNLCHPDNLREVISELDCNLGLDIKRWKNFPVYFLFRYKYDSYSQHYVVLEEIHRSKNYPDASARFLRLRSQWAEKIFLNMVPYRSVVK